MTSSKIFIYSLCALFSFFLFSCKKNESMTPVCDGGTPTYDANVKTIIDANCNNSSCHGSGSNNGDWTNYSGLQSVINNGAFNKEVLVDQTMPKGSRSLSQSELNTIQCWVNNGYAEN